MHKPDWIQRRDIENIRRASLQSLERQIIVYNYNKLESKKMSLNGNCFTMHRVNGTFF